MNVSCTGILILISITFITGCIYRDIINTVVCAKDGRPKHGLLYARIVIIQKGCTIYPPWIREMPLLEKVFVESASVTCNSIFNTGYKGRTFLVQAEHCYTTTGNKISSTTERPISYSSILKTSWKPTFTNYSTTLTTPRPPVVSSKTTQIVVKTASMKHTTGTSHMHTTVHMYVNATHAVKTVTYAVNRNTIILSTSVAIVVTAVTTLAVLFLVVKCLQKRRTRRSMNRVCEGPYSIPLSIVNENFGNTSL